MKSFYIRLSNYDVESENLYDLIDEFRYFKHSECTKYVHIYQIDDHVLKCELTRRFIDCYEILNPEYGDTGFSVVGALKNSIEVDNLLFSSIIIVGSDDKSVVQDFITQDGLWSIYTCPQHVKHCDDENNASLIYKISIKAYDPLYYLYKKMNRYIPYYKIDNCDIAYHKVNYSLIKIMLSSRASYNETHDIRHKAIPKVEKKNDDVDGFGVLLIIGILGGLIYGAYKGIAYLISLFF